MARFAAIQFLVILAFVFSMPCFSQSAMDNGGPDTKGGCCNRSGGTVNGGFFRIGGPVSTPRLISSVNPQYTEEARKAGVRGAVALWVLIEPDGCLSAVKVAKPLGGGLDEQAVAAVRCWKYEPAKKDGKPVRVQMLIEVPFPPSDENK